MTPASASRGGGAVAAKRSRAGGLGERLWAPTERRASLAHLTSFRLGLEADSGVSLPDYASLHRFSLSEPEHFWRFLFDWLGLVADRDDARVATDVRSIARCRWFPGTRLSFAENVLRRRDESPALIGWREDRGREVVSWRALHERTARAAKGLRAMGVGRGDRVVGVLPNQADAMVAMLATNAVGAIWSVASPDFGAEALAERFAPLEPRVLFAQASSLYKGNLHDRREMLRGLAARLPTLEHTISVGEPAGLPGEVGLERFLADHPALHLDAERLPFDHPAFVFFTSGTTGPPKCILHGQGGVLLQLMKEHVLHYDLKPHDRFFQFTTTGWNMWYWLVTALAVEATAVLYDGSPFHPVEEILFHMAAAEGVTHFGTSPAYLERLRRSGARPGEHHDLSNLRAVLSTGSPLPGHAFDFVYEKVKPDVCLSSISGGTEVMTCFATGDPTGPVHRGELQVPALGMQVEVFDDAGKPRATGSGELVCSQAFPSVPLGFWNDPTGARFRAAYLERFPGTWHHGDWAGWGPSGGFLIHGRSDATLKPGGIRIGTAELYRPVNRLEAVEDSVAIAQEWKEDVRVVLFVKLAPGHGLDAALESEIRRAIRDAATPRHVPACIVEVDDVPYTHTGKIAELAVRESVHGRAVPNRKALRNPEALDAFVGRSELAAPQGA